MKAKVKFSTHRLAGVYGRFFPAFARMDEPSGLEKGKTAGNYLRGFVFSAVCVSYLRWSGGNAPESKQAETDQWLELLLKEKGFGRDPMERVLDLANYVAAPKTWIAVDWDRLDQAAVESGDGRPETNGWEDAWANFSQHV